MGVVMDGLDPYGPWESVVDMGPHRLADPINDVQQL